MLVCSCSEQIINRQDMQENTQENGLLSGPFIVCEPDKSLFTHMFYAVINCVQSSQKIY